MAYLDDITLGGSPEVVSAMATMAESELAQLGLDFNRAKTCCARHTPGANIMCGDWCITDQSRRVVKALGAAVAATQCEESVALWALKRLQKQAAFFKDVEESNLLLIDKLRLLRSCGIPRAQFMIRVHQYADIIGAARWFDEQIAHVVRHILGDEVDDRAMSIAQLPLRMGGLGLRLYSTTAAFAHECVGQAGEQKKRTEAVERDMLQSIISNLSVADCSIIVSNTAPNANRYLTDCSLAGSDDATRVYLRQRVLLRVTPTGTKCTCGADATNAHIHSCTRIVTGPRAQRHDAILRQMQSTLHICGVSATVLEPHGPLYNRERPDMLICTAAGNFATDLTVTHAARATIARPVVLNAAVKAANDKNAKWAPWARRAGVTFAAVVFETNGGLLRSSRSWLHRVLAHAESPFDNSTAVNLVIGKMTEALVQGQHHVFACASGSG